MSQRNTRIDVLMGGIGGEAAVSRKSGAALVSGLQAGGYDVQAIDLDAPLDIAQLRTDALVFNIVHGTYGEDGCLQRTLEAAGRAYVGSDAQVSALCMDKERTKKHLAAAGIAVPWGVQVDLRHPCAPRDLKLPMGTGLVMKPAVGGSSIGLHMIANPSFVLPAMEHIIHDLGPIKILIEARLTGAEYTVAIIDDNTQAAGARALCPLRINTDGACYDYQAKYENHQITYTAVNDAACAQALRSLALQAYRSLGCRDIGRVDIMADRNGVLHVLEVNTLPGLTDHSLVPHAAACDGMSFPALCDHIIQQVSQRLNNTERCSS